MTCIIAGFVAAPPGMTLDLLPLNQRALVTAVDWAALSPNEAQRLQALGLDVGARVTVSRRGVLGGGDPLAVTVGRMTVALRRSHARAMTVGTL